MGHARVISRADDGLSLASLMVGAGACAVLPMGAAMAAAAAAPTIPAPSQPPATGPPVRVAYWPLPRGCLLGGGPVMWGSPSDGAALRIRTMTATKTLKAVDPQTGAVITRRTARTYVAALVFTGGNGELICDSWCGRPDLAQKALAKIRKARPSARLAPVVDPAAPAPHPCSAEAVADAVCQALAELSAEAEPAPARGPLLPGEAPRPAPVPAAGPAPELPVIYSQQQQQPQQAPAAAPAPLVQPGPLARKTAPAHLPADVAALLQRFGLTLDGLLTVGASNAKLAKGAALAWPVILHHLPARSLAAAIAGPEAGPTAPRSRLPGLAELAKAQNVYSLALAHNGCPWASAGCAAGCLAWAGHGGLSVTVASARARRTLALLADGPAYARAILWAIARAYRQAQAKGLPLAVRLRGTDDQPWHLARLSISPAEAQAIARRYGLPVAPGQGQTLAEALSLAPDGTIRLYEYSKAPTDGPLGLLAQQRAGFDVTASLAADRPGGLGQALQAVAAGFRLAVPVALAKGQPLPTVLGLRARDDRPTILLRCIDGDATDHRWADPAGPQPLGFDGVAVILRTKRSRGRGPAAEAFSLQPLTDGQPQALAGGGTAWLSWQALD